VTNLFQNLSVRENLRLAAVGPRARSALTFWRPVSSFRKALETAEQVARRLELHDRLDAPAYQLPHGQQRRLEVGLALAARPKLLLLDEPTSGMGVEDIETMRDLIVDLARDHTVVLIEHNMGIVMSISQVVTVMAQGEVLVEGPPDTVQDDDRVRAAYLGEDDEC
jgi:branched-chain amino acid transport system ATP-binding protein